MLEKDCSLMLDALRDQVRLGEKGREERRAFVEAEIQKRWKAVLAALDEKLSSGERQVASEGSEG